MATELETYLSNYINNRAGKLKIHLLTALEKEDQKVVFLETFQGTILHNQDLRDCEFLKDAGFFQEHQKSSRNAHNGYRVFKLTEMGKQIANELMEQELSKNALNTASF